MDTFFILAAKYLFILSIIVPAVYFFRQPWDKKKRMVLFGLASLIVSYGLGLLAGHLFFDPRPFVVGNFAPLIPHAPDNGFPSDHMLLTSTIAAISMFWNAGLGVALWIIAIVVGIGRVYVGVHHTIDVVGSALIALVATIVVRAVFRRFYSQKTTSVSVE